MSAYIDYKITRIEDKGNRVLLSYALYSGEYIYISVDGTKERLYKRSILLKRGSVYFDFNPVLMSIIKACLKKCLLRKRTADQEIISELK